MTPWLVLGRDGVINKECENGIKSIADWEPLPGSLDAIAALTQAGFKMVVAINQSSVARGEISEQTLAQVHDHMQTQITLAGGHLEGIFYCPHSPQDNCECRKPRVGLFQQIEKNLNINLAGAHCVGNSLKDIQAAKAMGLTAVLVRTGKGSTTAASILLYPKFGENTLVFDNLQQFAHHLINE